MLMMSTSFGNEYRALTLCGYYHTMKCFLSSIADEVFATKNVQIYLARRSHVYLFSLNNET